MNPSLGYQCLLVITWGYEQPTSVFSFAYLFVVAVCLWVWRYSFISFLFCGCLWDPFTEGASLTDTLRCNFMRWWSLTSLWCIKLCHHVVFYLKKKLFFFCHFNRITLFYFKTSLELFNLQAWNCIKFTLLKKITFKPH